MQVKNKLYQFALLFILLTPILSADTVEEIAKKAHLASINTLLIFTSQDSLNSGLYHFTKVGVDMHIYHLPFSYTINPNDDSIEYFLVGNVGYSKVNISDNVVIPPNSRLNYENYIATYTGGLGIGMRYKFSKELFISAGVEFIYSRSGTRVTQPDDNIGNAIEDFFNKNYNDNISYKLFTEAEYKPKIDMLNPYVKLSYKTYQTKSSFTFDELTKFTTDSSITTLTLGAETHKLINFDKKYLTLEAYLTANYLDGVVANTVQFNKYTSIGAVSYLYTNVTSWIKRYFLELNVVEGNGLNGYNIGIGFTIDY